MMQDMEEALLLDPENSDVIRQFQRAKTDFAEHKQLQALLPGKSSTTSCYQEHLEICKDIEARVRTLARLDMARVSTGGDKDIEPIDPAGLGALPQRASTSVDLRIAKVVKAVEALQLKVGGSDGMRVYFRACGGLAVTAVQLHAATRNPLCTAAVAPCAVLLNEACQLDSNVRVVAGCGLGNGASNSSAASAFAISLAPAELLQTLCCTCTQFIDVAVVLHTITTEEDARTMVADVLRSAKHPGSTQTTLACILHGAAALPATHRAVMFSLLSNCATVPSFQRALVGIAEAENCASVFCCMLQHEENPGILGRAASLVANVAASVTLRRQLAELGGVGTTLLARATEMQRSNAAGSSAALQACLSCLYNLALEGPIKAELVADAWFSLLADLLPAHGCKQTEAGICALGLVARGAQTAGAYEGMARCNLIDRVLVAALEAFKAISTGSEDSKGSAARIVDAAVRSMAVWGSAGHTEALRQDHLLHLLVWASSSMQMGDACAGNAALCLGYVADERCALRVPRT
jgi:hypothetical protein